MKYIIVSQKKSGSYLAGNLLKEFGIKTDGYHFKIDGYEKYDLNDLDTSRKNPDKFNVKEPIEKAIKLLKDETFGICHFKPEKFYVDLLKGFKKIILTRDYKERVNSHNLFQQETGRHRGAWDITDQDDERHHKSWLKSEDTFHVTYNDMIKKNVSLINELQNFLFDEIKYDSLIAITQAISKPSITKSSKR